MLQHDIFPILFASRTWHGRSLTTARFFFYERRRKYFLFRPVSLAFREGATATSLAIESTHKNQASLTCALALTAGHAFPQRLIQFGLRSRSTCARHMEESTPMSAVWVDWTGMDTCFSRLIRPLRQQDLPRPEILCLNGMAEVVLDDGRSGL